MARWAAVFATGCLLAALLGCGSNADVASCTELSCDGFAGAGNDATAAKDGGATFEAAPPVDSGPSRSLLCGTTGCFPGNRSACGVNPTSDAGYGYTVVDANDADPDGAGDSESSDAAADGIGKEDATDASTVPDAASDALLDVGATDEPRISQSCYIQPAEAGAGVATQCAPVGQIGEGGACLDSSDCIALYACVDVDGDHAGGVCRQISCALPIMCASGFFYQRASLRVAGMTRDDLEVPVCLPNDHCTPLAPTNPCTKPLTVCAVVGSGGETGCVIPGAGKQGDPCAEDSRCAEGLLCSKFNNQCVHLCHVAADVTECAGGTCQGGNKSIPEGFGICVGEIADASR